MKKHVIRISSIFILAMSLVIPATYSVYHDAELSQGAWGTGSVEIELKAKKSHKNSHNFKHKDNDSKDDPIALEVKNIGTQSFYYAMVGELTSGNPSKCDQMKVTLWKDSKGNDPVYRGTVADLVLQEVSNTMISLQSGEKELWWYQISFGKKSESCRGKLTAFAYQVEEKGGYEDQSSITLKKESSNNNGNDDWDWNDGWNPYGGIFEKIFHDDNKFKVKKYGPFLLMEYYPQRRMNRAYFSIHYSHIQDGKVVEEQATGELEPNAMGEFLVPEIYIGTCSTDEVSCVEHLDVTEMTVSLLLKDGQEIVENITLPVEWSEE